MTQTSSTGTSVEGELRSAREDSRLLKVLGPVGATLTLLAVTIGAGIYSVPQRVALNLSSVPEMLLLWGVIGGLCLVGGLIWAELGTRMPFVGGDYLYLTRSYGPHVGFLYGWKTALLTGPSNRAALAIVAADYIGAFVPLGEQQNLAVAVGVLVLTCGVNYVGLVWATRYQGLTALLKVIAITALIVAGLLVSGPALESVPATDIEQSGRGLVLAMLLIFFSYTGWTRLGYAAGEMKNPRRVLPRAIGIGLTITIVLYVLLNVVSFRLLGPEGVRGSNVVVSDVAAHIFGDGGSDLARLVVAGLIVVSVTGSMSVSIMANSRLFFAMAKDGLFFKRLDHIHPLFRTPDRAILFHGSAALVMLLVRHDFASLVTTAIFLNMAFYIIKTHTLFTLRRQGVGEEGCYRVPFYPWLPLLFLVSLYGLFVARLVLDWQRAWFDLALLALGIPASILWQRYRKP